MGRHRRKRGSRPVRTGLLGASAAMAVGAVAVASGLLPGGSDTFDVSGADSTTQAQQRKMAELLTQQGGATATPSQRATGTPSASSGSQSPTAKPTPTPTKPAKTAKPTPSAKPTKPAPEPTKTATPTPTPTPEKTRETKKPTERVTVPVQTARDVAAEAEVVRLVNVERAKVGCTPVHASAALNRLAGAFSADMANRAFFDHTDPDGDTPWDRAEQAGVSGLGGENIARGQADAEAVMDAWMNSDGHRANILNCTYTSMGVGVHFASGGPWWTQDFGF